MKYFLFFLSVFALPFGVYANTKKDPLAYNDKAPIRIVSDKATVKRKESKIFFEGKVKAKQDTITISSDKMIIKYKQTKNSEIEIKYIEAENNVNLYTKELYASGDGAFYDYKAGEITLSGNVIIKEETNTINAERFTYNVFTEETNITGKNGGRVTIILEDIKSIEKKIEEADDK